MYVYTTPQKNAQPMTGEKKSENKIDARNQQSSMNVH